MPDSKINLTELRTQRPEEIVLTQYYDPDRERDPEDDYTVAVIIPPDTLLALLDTAQAAKRKYDEMRDSERYWPNDHALRETLNRFTHE